MNKNLFDELAEFDIPPPPAGLGRDVHRRLNGRLLAAHLADLVLRALPYAWLHYSAALFGAAAYSLEETQSQAPPPGESPT